MAAILDEGLVCHLGFAVDGRPWVMPTTYARVENRVYVHGAAANFALKTLAYWFTSARTPARAAKEFIATASTPGPGY